MNPADDKVTLFWIMTMLLEVRALVFELNSNMYPAISFVIQSPFSFAIRVSCSNAFYQEAQFTADHTEQIDHALLVHGSVTEPTKVN